YHYGMPGVGGGFVGVDVFFVISGYLITGILAQEIRAGSFTLAGFYERRIRRIFPALLVVTLASFAAACLLLAPGAPKEFGSEMVWSSFFSTNIWFFKKDGYFDGTAGMRPLLHSWSLAVEEQFYIVI
ncbi:acyltransferase, partial [Leclercia adecarboxylata]|uniref:acyltransferase family protein n=1 Tax=Leclercia adecarboxylata TaxID=83655 RepID=UPI00234C41F7